MSRFHDMLGVTAALAQITNYGHSKHRKARVLRFVHRHPRAHRKIIASLVRQQQAHEWACDERFIRLRAAADAQPKQKSSRKRAA